MKKWIAFALVVAWTLVMCACGKSQAALECEALIAAIGEVSIDSRDTIEAAERAYSALTAEEKDSIAESAVVMNEAIDAYYVEACKLVFSTLNDAHEIVSQFGDDLYVLGNATKNGFKFPKGEFFYLRSILNTVELHLTEEDLAQGIEVTVEGHNLMDGYDAHLAVYVANTFHALGELCIKGISNTYILTNKVESARNALYEASVMMTEVEGKDSCAKYALILDKYYDAIEEYLEICLDCDSVGQLSQFGDMRSSYQGYTETYIGDLEALLAD